MLSGSFVIPSSGGFQRFCSNYLATSKEGFTKDILFTNEESPDYVLRQEDSWPPALVDPDQEENGVVLALDVTSGRRTTPIYGMGRHNHENDVAIPGLRRAGRPVRRRHVHERPAHCVPPGTTTPLAAPAPSQSQLYSYMAGNTENSSPTRATSGRSSRTTPTFDDYYDFTPGSTQSVTGHFIKVPKNIATGKNADGSEMKAADVGYPAPPTTAAGSGSPHQRPTVGIDGPQWVLEYWSQLNNVFHFVRVEDIAYDKRPGMGNVVYVVDSGRGTAARTATLGTPFRRRTAGSGRWCSTRTTRRR